MKKPRLTEEFLWKLYGALEGIVKFHQAFGARSLRDVVAPEMRKLRLDYEHRGRKRTFSQFVSYLKGCGYIKIPEGKSISYFQLTKKGREKALLGKAKTTEWPSRKDGKMIMLMYDIPKRKERLRHAFRSALEFLGYEMFQKSVWVSEKDVLAETEKTLSEYDLEDCVNLFVIERIRLAES